MGRVSASLQLPYPVDTVFAVATRIDEDPRPPRWRPRLDERIGREDHVLSQQLEVTAVLQAVEGEVRLEPGNVLVIQE